MTISEVLPQYSNVTNQPKVPITVLQSNYSEDQHWSVLLDKAGIIGPDGNVIELTSNATYAPTHDPNQLVAIFDTGFTLPQVPECVPPICFSFFRKMESLRRDAVYCSAVASAMYSRAKGANLQTIDSQGGSIWVIDCDAEVNVTFVIGGQSYPVHPLDTSSVNTDDDGNEICIGTVRVASLQKMVLSR
jgi:hypothetical protein